MLQTLNLDLSGPHGLHCSPKNGRKLHLGKKTLYLGFRAGQEASCLNTEFQDLINLAQFTVCLKNDFFFLHGNFKVKSFDNQYFY